jgi:hypothetical protein
MYHMALPYAVRSLSLSVSMFDIDQILDSKVYHAMMNAEQYWKTLTVSASQDDAPQ